MSAEIQLPFPGGHTLYAVVRDSAASVAGTVPVVEQGDTGWYVGDLPTPLAAGTYTATAYLQRGGDPDPDDPGVWYVELDWDGSKVIKLDDVLAASNPATIAAFVADALRPIYGSPSAAVVEVRASMTRGEDAHLPFTLSGVWDVGNAVFTWAAVAGGAVIKTKTVGDGITVVDADARQITVDFVRSETADIGTPGGIYHYDIWNAEYGRQFPAMVGTLKLVEPVRRPS